MVIKRVLQELISRKELFPMVWWRACAAMWQRRLVMRKKLRKKKGNFFCGCCCGTVVFVSKYKTCGDTIMGKIGVRYGIFVGGDDMELNMKTVR